MFTGIVEEVGTVTGLEGQRLTIAAEMVLADVKLGDSIAVNGACLTVVDFEPYQFSVELAPETLKRTSFGRRVSSDSPVPGGNLVPDGSPVPGANPLIGRQVNLERPLAVSDRLGGHIVQGHVDATGRITSLKPDGDCVIFRVAGPKRLMPYIVEKGFVAVDGISLTVVKVGGSSFTLSVIPYTLANTNLQSQAKGGRVNLEVDIVAKYVESLLAR